MPRTVGERTNVVETSRLTSMLDSLHRAAGQRGRAAFDDARLQSHLQHVGLRRC